MLICCVQQNLVSKPADESLYVGILSAYLIESNEINNAIRSRRIKKWLRKIKMLCFLWVVREKSKYTQTNEDDETDRERWHKNDLLCFWLSWLQTLQSGSSFTRTTTTKKSAWQRWLAAVLSRPIKQITVLSDRSEVSGWITDPKIVRAEWSLQPGWNM